MSILKKAGKCCECGGEIKAGDRVQWVSFDVVTRHGGNGVITGCNTGYKPKHHSFTSCQEHYASDSQLWWMKRYNKTTYTDLKKLMERGASAKEFYSFFSSRDHGLEYQHTSSIIDLYASA